MTARKLLLVGIDGLRIDDALRPSAMPHLAALVAGGELHRLRMEVPTISGPGWSSLVTGATHVEHGVFDNSFVGHRLASGADLLSRAWAADRTTTTFAAAGWPPLVDPAGPGPVIATRLDQQRAGLHRIVVRDGETYGHRWADGEIAAFARLALRDAGPDASFVYLGEVDEAGHLYGGDSPEYAAACIRVDALLGGLVAAVASRVAGPSLEEDWLIAVTTDHGHTDAGGHGGAEPVVTASFLALARFGPDPADPVAAVPADLAPSGVVDVLLAHLA